MRVESLELSAEACQEIPCVLQKGVDGLRLACWFEFLTVFLRNLNLLIWLRGILNWTAIVTLRQSAIIRLFLKFIFYVFLYFLNFLLLLLWSLRLWHFLPRWNVVLFHLGRVLGNCCICYWRRAQSRFLGSLVITEGDISNAFHSWVFYVLFFLRFVLSFWFFDSLVQHMVIVSRVFAF